MKWAYSILVPGLGQWVQGDRRSAAWIAPVVLFALWAYWPLGIVCHVANIIDAYGRDDACGRETRGSTSQVH
ncbi:MAG: hypothetical protein PHW60_15575 [Kiritimatiellae bacterium]|nr:hypothetical protein [Kiritimatiellia bacterium]